MQRWQVGKYKFYGESADEIRQKYGEFGDEITPLPYQQELFDKLTALPIVCVDSKGYEYRQVTCGDELCTYRVAKDPNDEQYYNSVQYMTTGKWIHITWSVISAEQFVDLFLRVAPEKRCGCIVSLKEVKKMCGKVWLKIGKLNVWRDNDGYYYVGNSSLWGKRFKDEYNTFSRCKDSAVNVEWTEGLYASIKRRWFESVEKWEEHWHKITAKQPLYAATLHYEIKQYGYAKKPVEDRKLICRLAYMNIECKLLENSPATTAEIWRRQNSKYFENDLDAENICRKIVRKVVSEKC